MKVLNYGSANLDLVYHVDHFVLPGETISARTSERNAGDVSYQKQVDELQGTALIQVDAQGENCIILFGGSNQMNTKEQVDETLSHFAAGDVLLVQNEVNELPYIVDKAYERGLKIILNPSPYDEKIAAVDLTKVSWLIANEVEGEQLSGSPDPDTIRAYVHERYPAMKLCIPLGVKGSMVFDGDDRYFQESIPCRAVDTTAAGDTFTGYFIAGLLEGKDMSTCMKMAATAASICVSRKGAAPAIPTRAEVEAALNS